MPNSVFLTDGVPFSGQMQGPAADNTAAPPFTFDGDLDTGLGSSAANTLNLVTGGVSALTLTSTAATFLNGVVGSFTNNALATTSTAGLTLNNATPATALATVQISPRFELAGTAWNSSGGGSSEVDKFFFETLPATVAGATTGTLKFGWKNAAVAATYPMTLTSAGTATILGNMLVGDGSATAASLGFAAETNLGFYRRTGTAMGIINSGSQWAELVANQFRMGSGAQVTWNSDAGGAAAADVGISRLAGSSLSVGNGTAGDFTGTITLANIIAKGANGQSLNTPLALTELTTIAAAGTTTTTIQMPANAVVLGVSVRVTTVIPTATSFSVGDAGSATRFGTTATISTAATTTDPGTKAAAYYNASATGILLTMNGGTPANNSGRVRTTIYYYSVTPPTS
jgi:hypothetical protein